MSLWDTWADSMVKIVEALESSYLLLTPADTTHLCLFCIHKSCWRGYERQNLCCALVTAQRCNDDRVAGSLICVMFQLQGQDLTVDKIMLCHTRKWKGSLSSAWFCHWSIQKVLSNLTRKLFDCRKSVCVSHAQQIGISKSKDYSLLSYHQK